MELSNLSPGTLLQSTAFTCVKAVVEKELLPGFYEWYLAKPDGRGGFVKFGFARFSAIETESWAKA